MVIARIGCAEVTHLQRQELCEELTQRVRYDSASLLVLDLGQVEFLSSTCLGSMVTFLQDLGHVRGRLALANCKPSVAFIFNVTRLDTVFSLYDDVDEACESVTKG